MNKNVDATACPGKSRRLIVRPYSLAKEKPVMFMSVMSGDGGSAATISTPVFVAHAA